ncbi:MAG: hypothetical protein KDC73_06965 [Ignavibacteriae bacterium]|nr:hypothetical protein [Ignavibacteriota bacterium]MCB9244632.1 hypothetical protein [Ignavibacteriales bacterium]
MKKPIKFRRKLPSKRKFGKRLLFSVLAGFLIVNFSLLIGIFGYHELAHLSWIDSFLNASMILGGMGPVDLLEDDPAKIFAGCYSLFSGVMFLTGVAVFITPIVHRILHIFHLSDIEDERK